MFKILNFPFNKYEKVLLKGIDITLDAPKCKLATK